MLIFVCSPMRGERPYTTAKYNKNMKAAVEYTRRVIEEGHTPITPHIMLKDALDDHNPDDREKGLAISKELLKCCDEVWVFAENGTSEGMMGEIEYASELGKQVRYK